MDEVNKFGASSSTKRKKKIITLPSSLSGIAGILPPPGPVLKSPRDETPITINGNVVDLDRMIEERINKASSPVVRPLSPGRNLINIPVQKISTPIPLPLNNVAIVDTPFELRNENTEEVDPNDEIFQPAPNTSMDFTSLILNAQNTPMKISSPVKEITPESESENEPEPEIFVKPASPVRPPPVIIPKIIPPPVSKPIEERVKSPIINLPVALPSIIKREEPEVSDSSPSTPTSEEESENVQVPVFSFKVRASSPIETLNAPKSPSPRPKFTMSGRSSLSSSTASTPKSNYTDSPPLTPLAISTAAAAVINAFKKSPIASPKNVPPLPAKNINVINEKISSPIRPKSPEIKPENPYLAKSPSKFPTEVTPVRTQMPFSNPEHTASAPVYIPPQYQQSEYNTQYKPDFNRLTDEQKLYVKTEYKVKFGILRANYPQWSIPEIQDNLPLEQIHDIYEFYIRQIMISKETGNYKVYLVVFFMIVEVIGVKILKLNMSGYTMSQLKRMHQYDQLLTELGEKWLISGGSNWPVEARILLTATFNGVIFLGVKYLCNWMGVEGLSDTIQNFFDSMINGPENGVNNPQQQSYIGPAAPSQPAPAPTDSSAAPQGNPLDGIAGVFGNLFGGNKSTGNSGGGGGGIAETIAQLGTMFTNKVQTDNKNKPAVQKQVPKVIPKKRLNKKSLFSD